MLLELFVNRDAFLGILEKIWFHSRQINLRQFRYIQVRSKLRCSLGLPRRWLKILEDPVQKVE